jgi:hypothetical protein
MDEIEKKLGGLKLHLLKNVKDSDEEVCLNFSLKPTKFSKLRRPYV